MKGSPGPATIGRFVRSWTMCVELPRSFARLQRIERGIDLAGAGMEFHLGAALQGDLLQRQKPQAADDRIPAA